MGAISSRLQPNSEMTLWQASLVSKFQATVERSGSCDYGKLRAVLRWAREVDHFTMQDLCARYDTSK